VQNGRMSSFLAQPRACFSHSSRIFNDFQLSRYFCLYASNFDISFDILGLFDFLYSKIEQSALILIKNTLTSPNFLGLHSTTEIIQTDARTLTPFSAHARKEFPLRVGSARSICDCRTAGLRPERSSNIQLRTMHLDAK